MRKLLKLISLLSFVFIINSCTPLMHDLEEEYRDTFSKLTESVSSTDLGLDRAASAESGNTNVAEVTVDSDGNLIFDIKNPGTTTVTVTDEDGTTKEISVTVKEDGTYKYSYTDGDGNTC